MRSVWFFKRFVIFALGAALLCAPLVPTPVGSQNLANGERGRPLVALAHSFQAQATAADRGVMIEWRTGFEPDILGFNIYRISNGQRTQINPGLINGSALIMRQTAPLGTYAWYDSSGNKGSEYYVESIDLRGQSNLHDLVKPVWSAHLPERVSSALLENSAASARAASKQTEWAEGSTGGPKENSAQSVGAESISDQWSIIANQPALKIGVRADGWYRITQAQMAAAGFNTSADARNLRLFVGGNEIAMHTSRDSGALTAVDFVEFWGQGLDVATTDTQIYWLVNGAQAGKRIAIAGEVSTNTAPAAPVKSPPASPPSNSPRDAPFVWLGGLRAGISGSAETEGSEQKSVSSEQKSVSSERGSSPTVREGVLSVPPAVAGGPNKQVGSRQKAAGSKPLAASSERGSSPTVREGVLSGPPASAGGPNTQPSNSKLRSTNSKLQIRKSKLRSRHRKHTRALRRNHGTMGLAAAPNFIYTVQRKDRGPYFSAALNGDQENFFGSIIIADLPPPPPAPTPTPTPPASVALNLNNVESTSSATAQVTVSLQGVSLITHQVNVLVNDMSVGVMTISQQDSATQTFSFPVSWLISGNNTVKFIAALACTSYPCHDTTLIDYVRLSYPHSFRADNDTLQFNLKSTLAARIDGFTSQNIRTLDISDPANVQAVHPIIETNGAGFALTIQPVGRTKGRLLVALPDTQFSQPTSLVLNTPSTLNATTNSASLVIISYKDFLPALDPLVAQRRSQGFVTVVCDVEDVFDEFSYGVHTPQAIKDFLSYTQTSWSNPKPAYVLLIGDASYDPRNYQGSGKFDFLPTKLVDTGTRSGDTALETASDDWLTDFDGDGIADISIGRLPVRTPAEANTVVSKVVNYSPANAPQSALLVADAQGSYYWNFELSNDQVATLLLPSNLTPRRVYRRLYDVNAPAGSINSSSSSAIVSGSGTLFMNDVHVGDTISRSDTGARLGTVTSIASNVSLTLSANASQTYLGTYRYTPSGTIGASSNSPTVTGTATSFTTELLVGDVLTRRDTGGTLGTVATIQSDTSLTFTSNASQTYSGVAELDVAARIRASFNSGQVLVVYSGHGNTNIWGGSIFSTDDAMALTNGNKLPFVVVMDCLNGFFTVPQASGQSLAEALVKSPNGGAVASFASSGLTIPDGQHQMGQVMFNLLYGNPTTIPIGDASRQSKAFTTDQDVRRTWILFGDPTMKIR